MSTKFADHLPRFSVIADSNDGFTTKAISRPWVRGVEDPEQQRYPTKFVVDGNVATQYVSLKNVTFPVVADPEFESPLEQLMAHRVPKLEEARTAAKDGPPLVLRYGRIYAGPNGLEFRLNNRGSLRAVELAAVVAGAAGAWAAAKVGGVALGPVVLTGLAGRGQQLLQMVAERLEKARGTVAGASAIAVLNVFAKDIIENDILRNMCIGITVLKPDLSAFGRAALAAMAMPLGGIWPQVMANARMWLEPCSSSQPLINSPVNPVKDVVRQPPPPPAPPKEQKAEVITTQPSTPGVTRENTPTSPPTTTRPKVRMYDISMTLACRQQHGAGTTDKYLDFDDPNSWVCVNAGDEILGGLDLVKYCTRNEPGTEPVLVERNAFGWRCRTKT